MNASDLPPLRIETCIPERREPGTMVFNVRPGGGAELIGADGWFIGVDREGNFPGNRPRIAAKS